MSEKTMTAEEERRKAHEAAQEQLEIELGEQARLASDSWDGVAPGKADNFKASFSRMIGLLSPYKVALVVVTLMGVASVVLTVLAPRVLGRATDVIFSGFISSQMPVGPTQEQVVEGLRVPRARTPSRTWWPAWTGSSRVTASTSPACATCCSSCWRSTWARRC